MNHQLFAASGLRASRRARAMRIAAASLIAGAAFLAAAAPAAAKPGDSFDFKTWDASGSGADSSQYSSLDQINKGNVANLTLAWSFKTGEGGQPPHFDPIVADGNMYVLLGGARGAGSTLVALDPATGAEKWRKQYAGGTGSRGMNYWQSKDGTDKRLLFMMSGNLTAVNADNGELIQTFGTNGGVDIREGLAGDITKVPNLQTDNPGRIFEDTIVMSLPARGVGFQSNPADIHAYDVVTGKLKWVFHAVPQKGEYGYETWPAKDHEMFGGVHNWSESTLDPETGIIYIPTGTGRFDFYGGNRKGNNLFANSLLAIDVRTGKRIWHYQLVHHDLWDYDIPQAPKLLTIHKGGKDIPVVIQATKFGAVFVFDRRNGKPIWPIVERKVPKSDVPGEQASPTQPFPTWPKPFARQSFTEAEINPYLNDADKAKLHEMFKTVRNEGLFTPPSLQGTISMPGHNGGANWGTSSVDPKKGMFFVVSKQLPTFDKLTIPTGAVLERAKASFPNGDGLTPYQSQVDFMLQPGDGQSAIGPPWSLITAYDMNTGKIMWSLPDGEVTQFVKKGIRNTGSVAPRGGPVATGGGIVFVGTSSDRKIRARDEETGKVLWEYDLPAATEGVPAVYEAGGREYLVLGVGGDGLFQPRLGQDPPGPSQYMAFALPRTGGQ